MKIVSYFFAFLFPIIVATQISQARTKIYTNQDLVNDSEFAYLGKILKVNCLKPNGKVVPIEKPCNGRPGKKFKNRFEYEIEVTKVISGQTFLKLPFIVKFDSDAENFENQKQPEHKQLGKKYIVLLKRAKEIPDRLVATRDLSSFLAPEKEDEIRKYFMAKK